MRRDQAKIRVKIENRKKEENSSDTIRSNKCVSFWRIYSWLDVVVYTLCVALSIGRSAAAYCACVPSARYEFNEARGKYAPTNRWIRNKLVFSFSFSANWKWTSCPCSFLVVVVGGEAAATVLLFSVYFVCANVIVWVRDVHGWKRVVCRISRIVEFSWNEVLLNLIRFSLHIFLHSLLAQSCRLSFTHSQTRHSWALTHTRTQRPTSDNNINSSNQIINN